MIKIAIWLLFLASSSAAFGECKIVGPNPMYLGKNTTYKIVMTLEQQGLCNLAFDALSDAVEFTSTEITQQPTTGKLSSTGKFSFTYTATGAGKDQFTLSVCGTDLAGTGCDRLNYFVDVK